MSSRARTSRAKVPSAVPAAVGGAGAPSDERSGTPTYGASEAATLAGVAASSSSASSVAIADFSTEASTEDASVASSERETTDASTTDASADASGAEAPMEIYKSFDDMGLPEQLLRGVYSSGFDRPSEIQTKAVVPIKKGRDALIQSQSGTGKTATFLTGGFCHVDPKRNEVQMVVISPTRELAEQTGNVAKTLGQFMGVRIHLATGGVSVDADLDKLGRGSPAVPHLLVVTPGRFYDLLKRNAVRPSTIKVLVMDEADQLLDAKFKEQILYIMSEPFIWPSTTQIVLVSATMIPAIAEVAKTLLVRDPFTILRDPDTVTLEGIRQFFIKVDHDDQKLDTLCDLSDVLTIQQAVIFANSRKSVEKLANDMIRRGFDVGFIHGEMDAKERKHRMGEFRTGKTRVLISTDLLARGIDVQQISLVINFELPVVNENYIHRIGRSGRYGRKGASINIVTPREERRQEEIETFYSKKVEELPMDLNIY